MRGRKASPISLRLTSEERARLEKAASGLGLSEYIRQKLFEGKDRAPRGKSVVADHVVAAMRMLFGPVLTKTP